MLMNEYWKTQEQEKELLKKIAKWRYRAKHQTEKRFYSDRQIDLSLKYGEVEKIGEWTAQDRLDQTKRELKKLRTPEYKKLKRFFKTG